MDDAPSLPAPLPESFSIPVQSLEAWNKVSPTEYVQVRLTKGDIDHLFFSVDKLVHANDATNSALVNAISGQTDLAYGQIHSSTARLIEAQNNLRQFLSALMACVDGGVK